VCCCYTTDRRVIASTQKCALFYLWAVWVRTTSCFWGLFSHVASNPAITFVFMWSHPRSLTTDLCVLISLSQGQKFWSFLSCLRYLSRYLYSYSAKQKKQYNEDKNVTEKWTHALRKVTLHRLLCWCLHLWITGYSLSRDLKPLKMAELCKTFLSPVMATRWRLLCGGSPLQELESCSRCVVRNPAVLTVVTAA
jgi:hypothetical protein